MMLNFQSYSYDKKHYYDYKNTTKMTKTQQIWQKHN